jgi:hypothetical protein
MSGTTCVSSGLRTADAPIYVGRGTLNAFTVVTDGTNAATVTLYDNATAATGNVLAKMVVGGSAGTGFQAWNLAVRCLNGIFADVSGTGAGYIVYFGA